jgi:hypothetical protein
MYSRPPAVDVNPNGPASTTAHQMGTYTNDPYAGEARGDQQNPGRHLSTVRDSGGNVLDVSPLVAIIVYALVAWVLVKVVGLVMGDSRHGVRTISSQIDTRVR